MGLVRCTCTALGLWLAALLPSQAVTFIPPDHHTIPIQRDGGLSRSGIRFTPPQDNPVPQRAVGGASRIGFTPPQDNPRPLRSTGGGSRIGFIPPPNTPVPTQTANGGSRNPEDIALVFADQGFEDEGLNENATAMTAVTPSSLYGLTVSARPSVLAYLPETKAHTAIFSLKNESQAVIYWQVIPLDGANGILKIRLPDNAPELSIGENYQWFITLQTEDYITPGSPYVTAWIKRVEASSILPRADFSTQDGLGLTKARVLAHAGIWYDAAEQLATLQIDPATNGSTVADWTEFLTSVGLDELSKHSFLD